MQLGLSLVGRVMVKPVTEIGGSQLIDSPTVSSDPVHDCLVAWRTLPDGREVHITPATFGRARLNVTDDPSHMFYSDVYCYADPYVATLAMYIWDPEKEPDPMGWEKHVQTGRYREHGNPANEKVY